MPFDTLSERLKIVARGSLAKCRAEWGRNGLKTKRGRMFGNLYTYQRDRFATILDAGVKPEQPKKKKSE